MSFLQNSTTFAPYLNMKPHRTYILYISICLWLLASPLCIGNLWGKDFVVVIDAGHGGHDPGAIGKISKEKNVFVLIFCLSIIMTIYLKQSNIMNMIVMNLVQVALLFLWQRQSMRQ